MGPDIRSLSMWHFICCKVWEIPMKQKRAVYNKIMKDQAWKEDYFRPGSISTTRKCVCFWMPKESDICQQLSYQACMSVFSVWSSCIKGGQGNEITGFYLPNLHSGELLFFLLTSSETGVSHFVSVILFITVLTAEICIVICEIKYETFVIGNMKYVTAL